MCKNCERPEPETNFGRKVGVDTLIYEDGEGCGHCKNGLLSVICIKGKASGKKLIETYASRHMTQSKTKFTSQLG